MPSLLNELRRNLAQAEEIGNKEWAKALQARIDSLEATETGVSQANTKAELLEAANAAGLDLNEKMTKAEILEALDAAE